MKSFSQFLISEELPVDDIEGRARTGRVEKKYKKKTRKTLTDVDRARLDAARFAEIEKDAIGKRGEEIRKSIVKSQGQDDLLDKINKNRERPVKKGEKFYGKPTGVDVKTGKAKYVPPKEIEGRSQYIDPKTNKASEKGIKSYINKARQMRTGSNVPVDSKTTDSIAKFSKSEYETKINQKYGGRRAKRARSNAPSFAEVQRQIDKAEYAKNLKKQRSSEFRKFSAKADKLAKETARRSAETTRSDAFNRLYGTDGGYGDSNTGSGASTQSTGSQTPKTPKTPKVDTPTTPKTKSGFDSKKFRDNWRKMQSKYTSTKTPQTKSVTLPSITKTDRAGGTVTPIKPTKPVSTLNPPKTNVKFGTVKPDWGKISDGVKSKLGFDDFRKKTYSITDKEAKKITNQNKLSKVTTNVKNPNYLEKDPSKTKEYKTPRKYKLPKFITKTKAYQTVQKSLQSPKVQKLSKLTSKAAPWVNRAALPLNIGLGYNSARNQGRSRVGSALKALTSAGAYSAGATGGAALMAPVPVPGARIAGGIVGGSTLATATDTAIDKYFPVKKKVTTVTPNNSKNNTVIPNGSSDKKKKYRKGGISI